MSCTGIRVPLNTDGRAGRRLVTGGSRIEAGHHFGSRPCHRDHVGAYDRLPRVMNPALPPRLAGSPASAPPPFRGRVSARQEPDAREAAALRPRFTAAPNRPASMMRCTWRSGTPVTEAASFAVMSTARASGMMVVITSIAWKQYRASHLSFPGGLLAAPFSRSSRESRGARCSRLRTCHDVERLFLARPGPVASPFDARSAAPWRRGAALSRRAAASSDGGVEAGLRPSG